jgi:hypothetical protein
MKQAKEENSSRVSNRLQEIYAGKYGYRKTASGNWRERDEPNSAEQDGQNDAIQKMLNKKKLEQSKDRLKAANKVPNKGGKKMFEAKTFKEFMLEAKKHSITKEKSRYDDDVVNLYNAANALDLDSWMIFVDDFIKSRIKID